MLHFRLFAVLLACNLYILYSQKAQIIQFIKSLDFTRPVTFTGKTLFLLNFCKGSVIVFAVFMVGMKAKNVLFKSDYQRKYETLVGMYTLESMKKNSMDYTPGTNDSLYYKDLYIEKQSRWNILRRFNNKTDAFILELNHPNDSITLYINTGGIGDGADIKDHATVLKGIYALENDLLTLRGVQANDTPQLNYKRQGLRPKEWFW